MKRVFRSFALIKRNKLTKNTQLVKAIDALSQRHLESVWFAWRRYHDEKRQRALLASEVSAYYSKKVLR